MEITQERLLEAKRQITSIQHTLGETRKTLEAKEEPRRYRSQITLIKRRLDAFELALQLIDRELNRW